MPRVLSPPGAIWYASGVLRRYPAGGGANLLVDKAWKDPVRLKLRVETAREGNEVLRDRDHTSTTCIGPTGTLGTPMSCGNAAAGRIGSPFFHADGRPLDVDELLAAGLDINTVDAQGNTPLHAAAEWLSARRRADDLIDRLIDAGGIDVCRQRGVADCRGSTVTRTPPPADDADWQLRPPPTAAKLRRLREAAKRGRYRSLVHLARGLYLTGLGPREVLAECFGVTFPDELFVIVEADPYDAIPGDTTNLPWELAVPLDRGGPVVRPTPLMWPAERRIFTWDPDLVPLVALYGDYRVDHGAKTPQPRVPHGDLIHCYRLSELAAGRSTVVGVPWHQAEEDLADGEWYVKPCGQSLLTVLHEYLAARHRLNEWEIMQPWNWGAGSIDDTMVEESRECVAEIGALQRRLGDRTGPTEK
jgi:hypothetical protein